MDSSYMRLKSREKKHRPKKSLYQRVGSGSDEEDASGKVYIFKEGVVNQSDDADSDCLELQNRGNRSRMVKEERKPEEFIERDLKTSETLQTIALQYECPVAELKRVNNIIRENEIFARRTVKLPMKPYSLLSEIITNEKNDTELKDSIAAVNGEASSIPDSRSSDSETDIFVRTVSIGNLHHQRGTLEASKFLKHMDKDLEIIREKTQTYKSSLEEVANSLTCRRFYPLNDAKKSECSGADWGLEWWKILLIMLVVVIVFPVVYFVYLIQADTESIDYSNSTIAVTPKAS